ncbi:MAG: YggN family protein [Alteromonas stellipolaris]|uniref:YggN family protein n=1 Tax=Alteromonas stellipolaris TaxID=233316 RepID=UPI003B8D9327
MKYFERLLLGIVGTVLFAGWVKPASAEIACNIDFAYGLAVNDTQLRVMEKSRTRVQINDQTQLFIDGRWQTLSAEQSEWLGEYAHGLHYVVPKMIVLATEGVDLAVDTIESVYLGLVGSDHDSYERLNSAMKRVKVRVKDKFRHASNHYFIGPGSLESVDDFVDSEIEAQLEEAISTSVGGILSAISGINTNSDEVNSEKVAEITRQLGTVGEQLERDMNSKATSLRNKAEWICNKLKRLDVAEEKLRASIPALQPYNLITSHSPEETE